MAAQLRSSKPEQQLAALRQLRLAKEPSASDETYRALFDCISDESPAVRAEAFGAIARVAQSFAASNLSEIVSVAFAEIASAEDPGALAAALTFLSDLSDEHLFAHCGSKDGIAALHFSDTITESDVLSVAAYPALGRILLRLLLLVDEGMEDFAIVESSSDMRRHCDEILDFVYDVYGKIAQRIASMRPPLDCFCSVLLDAVSVLNECASECNVREHALALLGLTVRSRLRSYGRSALLSRGSRLAHLLRHTVPMLGAHPLLLMNHWKQEASACDLLRALLSGLMLAVVASIPNDALYRRRFELRTRQGGSLLEAALADDTSSLGSFFSCGSPADAAGLADEWVRLFLVPSLSQSVSQATSLCIVEEALALVGADLLLPSRQAMSDVLCSAVLACVHRGGVAGCSADLLAAHALALLRFASNAFLARALASVSELIAAASSNAMRLRLVSELWALLLGLGESSSRPFSAPLLAHALSVAMDPSLLSCSTVGLCTLLTRSSTSSEEYLSCAVLALSSLKSLFINEAGKRTFRAAVLAYVSLLDRACSDVFASEQEALKKTLADLLLDLLRAIDADSRLPLQVRAIVLCVAARHLPRAMDTLKVLAGAATGYCISIFTSCTHLLNGRKQLYEDLSLGAVGGPLGGEHLDSNLTLCTQRTPLLVCLHGMELVVRAALDEDALRSCFVAVEDLAKCLGDMDIGDVDLINESMSRVFRELKTRGVDGRAKAVDTSYPVSSVPSKHSDTTPPPPPEESKAKGGKTPEKKSTAVDVWGEEFSMSTPTLSNLAITTTVLDPFGFGSSPAESSLSPRGKSSTSNILDLFASVPTSPVSPGLLALSPAVWKNEIVASNAFDVDELFSACFDFADTRLVRPIDSEGQEALYISSLELFAIVDDVFLSNCSKSSASDEVHRDLAPDDHLSWQTLSGSGDLLQVCGTFTHLPEARLFEVKIRVFNGAGFKIPSFSVGLTLAEEGITKEVLSLLPDSNSCSAFIEDLKPNGYCIKRMYVSVNTFGSASIGVRISYDSLLAPNFNDTFNLPESVAASIGVSPSVQSRHTSKRRSSVQESASKFCAVVYLAPLLVSVTAQLVAYGYEAFSGSGVPRGVFQQLWDRLSHFSRILVVPSLKLSCIAKENSEKYVSDLLDSALARTPLAAAVIRFSAPSSAASKTFGWAFQTLQGCAIAVHMSVVVRASACTGVLEIKCATHSLLESILADRDSFLRAISSGLFTCESSSSGSTSLRMSPFDVSI